MMMHDEAAEIPAIFCRYPDGDIIALWLTISAVDRGHCSSHLDVGQHEGFQWVRRGQYFAAGLNPDDRRDR